MIPLPPFPIPPIDELLDTIVMPWCEEHSAHAIRHGRALTPDEMQIAACVGAEDPKRIRVLSVPQVPFPENKLICSIAEHVGLSTGHIGSLTLGHGIIIRKDQQGRADVWPHEFRHVAQCECLGGLRWFMRLHILEAIHFGYGMGPLEIDAKHAELLI
ncbi:MAG: hypothetical protein LBI02_07155 [Opitutaceae bacterium]|jgi:hypothetical protein|nr:hypothetical protein [Opitutaceae bacterium]